MSSNDSRLDFKVFPKGDTERGVSSYYWLQRKKAERSLSVASNQRHRYDRLASHCYSHPNDLRALERFCELLGELGDVDLAFEVALDKFHDASAEYKRKMLELSEVPFQYWSNHFLSQEAAVVEIMDKAGSVKIFFGARNYDGSWTGYWILYANGALDKVRTPKELLNE